MAIAEIAGTTLTDLVQQTADISALIAVQPGHERRRRNSPDLTRRRVPFPSTRERRVRCRYLAT